ncbi:MAG: YdeI/OmpD-associated family protein [Chloroflexi bacterium]|nr:YdeI/OmpD-associated family protein [Chloroflexota bacterium]
MTEPKKRAIDDYELVYPQTRADWRAWLAANHDKSPGIWLVRYKVSTKQPTITYDELVEEALCFGWIDGLARGLDAERHLQLLTPRKPKSVWSKINKERIERLLAAGVIEAPGLKVIEIAKANGSWSAIDDVEALTVPPDLGAALEQNPAASQFFYGLANTYKKGILQWIASAKRPETRQKRIDEAVAQAALGKKANYPNE